MRVCLLSFSVDVTEVPVDDYSMGSLPARPRLLRLAVVKAYINGQPLLPRYVFDAFEVLAQGTDSGNLHLFTCGCGEPGCIGVDEECYLGKTGRLVCWRFPRDPFEKPLTDLWPDTENPLELRFSETQYKAALAQLERQLLEIEAQSSKPFAIAPDAFPSTVPMAERLSSRRQQKREDTEMLAERVATFGALLSEDVRAALPGGLAIRVPAWTVALAAAHLMTPADVSPTLRTLLIDEVLANELVPKMLTDRNMVIKTAKTIGLDILSEWMTLEFSEGSVTKSCWSEWFSLGKRLPS